MDDGGSPPLDPAHEALPPTLQRDEQGVQVVVLGGDGPPQERLEKSDTVASVAVYHAGDGIQRPHRALVYRAQDLLLRLLRNGTIDEEMYAAGRAFQAAFTRAQLDPLRAADMARLPGLGDGGVSPAVLDARAKMAELIDVLGGHRCVVARVAWQCLGIGDSIGDWAEDESGGSPVLLTINKNAAKGVLLAALSILTTVDWERLRDEDETR